MARLKFGTRIDTGPEFSCPCVDSPCGVRASSTWWVVGVSHPIADANGPIECYHLACASSLGRAQLRPWGHNRKFVKSALLDNATLLTNPWFGARVTEPKETM